MIHDRIAIGDYKVIFNHVIDEHGDKHSLREKFFKNKEINAMESFFASQLPKNAPVTLVTCTHICPQGIVTWQHVKSRHPGE